MPEVPVDEHGDAEAWQHKIRSAAHGKLRVQPEPIAKPVKFPAHQQFRLSVDLPTATRRCRPA
jgi:hypothetical protein